MKSSFLFLLLCLLGGCARTGEDPRQTPVSDQLVITATFAAEVDPAGLYWLAFRINGGEEAPFISGTSGEERLLQTDRYISFQQGGFTMVQLITENGEQRTQVSPFLTGLVDGNKLRYTIPLTSLDSPLRLGVNFFTLQVVDGVPVQLDALGVLGSDADAVRFDVKKGFFISRGDAADLEEEEGAYDLLQLEIRIP